MKDLDLIFDRAHWVNVYQFDTFQPMLPAYLVIFPYRHWTSRTSTKTVMGRTYLGMIKIRDFGRRESKSLRSASISRPQTSLISVL